MTKPVFKNRENEFVELVDGRKVHLSRSPAICVPVTAITEDGTLYTLVSKRGEGTPNFQQHWNLICGYLDYDEDLYEAAFRELWEESGFDAQALKNENIIYTIEQLPWAINSKPNSGTQNVTHRYGLFFKVKTVEDLPELSNEYSEPNEVVESRWMSSSEVLNIKCHTSNANPLEEPVWAFNHFEVYREWVNHITG